MLKANPSEALRQWLLGRYDAVPPSRPMVLLVRMSYSSSRLLVIPLLSLVRLLSASYRNAAEQAGRR